MGERIWERFLTEQDRAHLALLPPPVHPGFGQRPAVLSIDNYLMAVGDRRESVLEAARRWPGACGLAAWEALEETTRLFAVARAAGVPIVHVNRDVDFDEIDAPKRAPKRYEPAGDPTDYRNRFDFVEQARPLPGEMVLRKTTPSAFFSTGLDRYLRARGIDTLVVCGESTSGCVRASVVDGNSSGFRMIVVEECVYDRHEATHAINLFDMDEKYAEVMAIDAVLERFASTGSRHLPPGGSDNRG